MNHNYTGAHSQSVPGPLNLSITPHIRPSQDLPPSKYFYKNSNSNNLQLNNKNAPFNETNGQLDSTQLNNSHFNTTVIKDNYVTFVPSSSQAQVKPTSFDASYLKVYVFGYSY
jgi:hypothetical protein